MSPESTAVETPAECPSCHTPEGRPHTDYCRAVAACQHTVIEYDERGWGTCRLCWQPVVRQAEQWLGHRDLCPTQWGESCDCVLP